MAIERIYNVQLRKEFMKAPKYRRAKKAVIALREFLAKHMKADLDKVKIQQYANLLIWKRGMQSPPHHIKIKAVKQDDGIVIAELVGAPEKKVEKLEEKTEKAVKAEPGEKAVAQAEQKIKKLGKKALQKEMQQVHAKVEEAAAELKEQIEEHQEEAKKVQEEEIKELKHEQETVKRHKPRAPKEDRSQYNRKKEMIPEGKR